MKVLYITTVPAPYKVMLFEEMGKFCDLEVVFENEAVSYRNRDWMVKKFYNFKAHFIKGLKIKDKKISLDIIKILKEEKYDIVIIGVYSTFSQMITQLYMKAFNIPYVLSSDGGVIKEESKIKFLFKKYFIKGAIAWLGTGKMTTEYLCHYGAKQNQIYSYPFTSVLANDVLTKTIQREEKAFIREKLGIKEKNVILAIGQFIPRKGFDLLLKAATQIKIPYGIYIIGGIPTKEYLRIQEEYRLNNIHFIQFKDKKTLSEYYKAADIFVLPTREDIWGLVVNEAMANGVPVVTTFSCVAGIEMIDGTNGYLINADNVKELADTINKALESDLCVMSEECLKTARKYTIESSAKRHIQIFNQILERL